MSPDQLIQQIKQDPKTVEFDEVMAVINTHYAYTDTRFTNGVDDDMAINEAGSNAGSCRIFASGQLHGLKQAETLASFRSF